MNLGGFWWVKKCEKWWWKHLVYWENMWISWDIPGQQVLIPPSWASRSVATGKPASRGAHTVSWPPLSVQTWCIHHCSPSPPTQCLPFFPVYSCSGRYGDQPVPLWVLRPQLVKLWEQQRAPETQRPSSKKQSLRREYTTLVKTTKSS